MPRCERGQSARPTRRWSTSKKSFQLLADMDTREAVNRSIENEIKQRMFAGVMEEYALRFVDQVMAPDSNKPLKPRKALPMVVGFMMGRWFVL